MINTFYPQTELPLEKDVVHIVFQYALGEVFDVEICDQMCKTITWGIDGRLRFGCLIPIIVTPAVCSTKEPLTASINDETFRGHLR